VPRRVSLPGADELFRATDDAVDEADRRSTGRVRHDEKITVYLSPDELLDLEHAKLALRRAHRITTDRGRLVREAIAIALADLELRGAESVLVERLRER
jgi:hypothetical protein